MAENEDIAEQIHFQKVVDAFRGYKSAVSSRVEQKIKYVDQLSKDHQNYLKEYRKTLNHQLGCINHNADIIKLIIEDVETMFENAQRDANGTSVDPVNSADLDKIMTTFRQLVRDWSEEGKGERNLCYSPIINSITKDLFPTVKNKEDIQILVPGAGLGRLAFELAKLGYSCQGNEFSLFMLFTANFILNKCHGVNSITIYPWVHNGSNVKQEKDQIRQCQIPDIDPSEISENSQLTMAAGDFLEIYTEADLWDCVATCFFIDCAENIITFIEAIYKIIKPGGYWINNGPLLYHFADIKDQNSIEPSWNIVQNIIIKCGFKFVKTPLFKRTTYTQNPRSMLKNEFESIFFVAQKTNGTITN